MTSPMEFENIQIPFSAISREFLRRMEEGGGLFWVFLPYSDLGRWIPEGGAYGDAWRNFPMQRLGQVKSLSFLSYHGPSPEEQYFLPFSHDRLGHSLNVALVSDEILKQNGGSVGERNKIDLAASLHDIATPALGDATKKADPINLSEETHWREVLDEEGLRLLSRYGTTQEEMDKIIKNEGILGQVLDISDRLTYVMQDLFAVAGYQPTLRRENPYIEDIRRIISSNLNIGNIYKDVQVNQATQEVFFKNPRRLKAFLLLRAVLHQKLYMHPVSMGRDRLVAGFIKPFYFQDSSGEDPNILTPAKLRRMTDNQLIDFLWQHYGAPPSDPDSFFENIVNWYPKHKKFESEEEARKYRQELSERDNTVVIDTVECKGFDPGTSYKVADSGGGIVPFGKFDPEGASEIEEVERSTHGVFVFYTDVSDVTQPLNEVIKKAAQLNSERAV